MNRFRLVFPARLGEAAGRPESGKAWRPFEARGAAAKRDTRHRARRIVAPGAPPAILSMAEAHRAMYFQYLPNRLFVSIIPAKWLNPLGNFLNFPNS